MLVLKSVPANENVSFCRHMKDESLTNMLVGHFPGQYRLWTGGVGAAQLRSSYIWVLLGMRMSRSVYGSLEGGEKSA